MNLNEMLLVANTVRHLKPIQVYARARRAILRKQCDIRRAPARRPVVQRWTTPAARLPSMVGPLDFSLLGQRISVDAPQRWNDPAWPHLLTYNIHYFDDLNAARADERTTWHREAIERWINENPPAVGAGWEPYPISVRIVNWIKWVLRGNELSASALDSLATQTEYLRGRLEYHLLGNHLLANAKALLFAGAFFDGPLAGKWLQNGLKLFDRQLGEQVLDDGGHFELSPMYHSIVLEDVLDTFNLLRAFAVGTPLLDSLCETAGRMRGWLLTMCHPDGEISLFNDATFDAAPSPSEIEAYAGRLELPPSSSPRDGICYLPNSGYIRLQRDAAVAILDVGRIGPNYQPGHAHADTLSFELSLGDARVVVNSGISCYGVSSQRSAQRGTAAHNTVEVDSENSSEVWGGFRVARRAYPADLRIEQEAESLRVCCGHTGYLRLPGRVRHQRKWELRHNQLSILDSLSGRFRSARALLHFHPDVGVARDQTELRLSHPSLGRESSGSASGSALTITVDPGCRDAELQSYDFHPGFGRTLPSTRLCTQFRDAMLQHVVDW